jgi:hypothetical protein
MHDGFKCHVSSDDEAGGPRQSSCWLRYNENSIDKSVDESSSGEYSKQESGPSY